MTVLGSCLQVGMHSTIIWLKLDNEMNFLNIFLSLLIASNNLGEFLKPLGVFSLRIANMRCSMQASHSQLTVAYRIRLEFVETSR
jgi:hypothetical protein